MAPLLAEVQAGFAAALLDPAIDPPACFVGTAGEPARRRFAIHRNTIMVGLVEALEQRFPVTRRLVGEEFFHALARSYAAENRPRTPVMLLYGDSFPDFVDGYPPALPISYLADVARLEAAWTRAYHAPEADTIGLGALRGLAPEILAESRLAMHPTLSLVRSPHPIGTIWQMHQEEAEPAPLQDWRSEEILVTRPGAEVEVRVLPPGGYSFLAALMAGDTVGEAAESALAAAPKFDPAENLAGAFETGAVSRIINDARRDSNHD